MVYMFYFQMKDFPYENTEIFCIVKAEGIQGPSYIAGGSLKYQSFGKQFVNIYENYQYISPLI